MRDLSVVDELRLLFGDEITMAYLIGSAWVNQRAGNGAEVELCLADIKRLQDEAEAAEKDNGQQIGLVREDSPHSEVVLSVED